MRPIRVYVDTSVFGGTRDFEFAFESNSFFRQVRKGKYIVILSDETLRELARAPEPVRKIWRELPSEAVEEVTVNNDIVELSEAYIKTGVLAGSSISDALHVAVASVVGADLILSWNFKHIVNYDRIRGFNSVNAQFGYRQMTILSPLEISHESERE